MPAWMNSWISDRLDRMSKQGDNPNYSYGGSCGSAKGVQQLIFMLESLFFCTFSGKIFFGKTGPRFLREETERSGWEWP